MNKMIKRIFDILVSIFALICLLPIILVISLLIIADMGMPVLFTQVRPGLNGNLFRIIKFRTMSNERGSDGELLTNSQRTTNLGLKLRNSSLDELPELWNVLKGEMSLVGPRPLKESYLELYNNHQKKRHSARPGITGWAQINGRNTLSWEDRFDLDVWYVENQNLWLDIKILFLTVIKVLKKDGVEHPLDEVQGRFTGNKDE
jgi:sugar transferase EpsL